MSNINLTKEFNGFDSTKILKKVGFDATGQEYGSYSKEHCMDAKLGYEPIDMTTIVDRKRVPLGSSDMFMNYIYDFNAQFLTISTHIEGADNSITTKIKNFEDVPGKQAIFDAHRALVEFHGSPPPIETILNLAEKYQHMDKYEAEASTPVVAFKYSRSNGNSNP